MGGMWRGCVDELCRNCIIPSMFSTRFQREVIITHHALQRMSERQVEPALLLKVIDFGLTRYSDATHLWVWLEVPERNDNLVLRGACAGELGYRENSHAPLGVDAMKTTYFDDEDTLVIRLSDKPIVREVSQDWRTHIAFAADGSVVETVILEARESGAWPMTVEHRQAA